MSTLLTTRQPEAGDFSVVDEDGAKDAGEVSTKGLSVLRGKIIIREESDNLGKFVDEQIA